MAYVRTEISELVRSDRAAAKFAIRVALEASGGSTKKAAKALGISHRTMSRYVALLGLGASTIGPGRPRKKAPEKKRQRTEQKK